jgi:hypothetical protein
MWTYVANFCLQQIGLELVICFSDLDHLGLDGSRG